MANSNAAQVVRKPRPDFPLFPHATGRWAKKVRGKLVYFGKTADDTDGQRALSAWLDQRDDLLAGRTPRVAGEGLTVRDLCNRFLTAKMQARDAGELAPRTWAEYKLTTDRIVDQFGKTRLVSDLASGDFETLKASFAKTRGPEATGNEVQRTRVLFKYAYDAGLIDHPMRYGPSFKRPSKKVMRKVRAQCGAKMFEAVNVRELLKSAGLQLRSMILFALNCGFGNNDCATLPIAAIDLDGGWIKFPRPKTGIDRRCPLWPETVKALRAVLGKRKPPKDPAHAGLLYVTKRGGTFAKETPDNPVSKEFTKLVKEAGLFQRGRGFYSLRHTFRTVAGGAKDLEATRFIMGHANQHVEDAYIESIEDDRLQSVAAHVRKWLFPKATKGKPDKAESSEPKAAREPRAMGAKPTKGRAETTGPVLLKLFSEVG